MAGIETQKPEVSDLNRQGNLWLERIIDAEKRENAWMKDASAAEKAYAAETSSEYVDGKIYDFNILHSNVETIVPAIYNSTPVPDIRRRRIEATGLPPQPPEQPDEQAMLQYQQQAQEFAFRKQVDEDAKAYGAMLEKAISIQIDDNKLDVEIEQSAQDAFLAGRGILRLRFDADVTDESVSGERIDFEVVSWRDYREGPAKRWNDVPWVAFRQIIAHETFERLADSDLIAEQGAEKPVTEAGDEGDIEVWEVWDKLKGVVVFVRASDGKIVRMEDDPLGLPGFFPVPKPVQPICLTGKRTPVCPFSVYKKLADELDVATKRISKIMEGLRVRGIAAGNAAKLVELASARDNEIIIEEDLEQLVQTGGLDKAIAWWPIEQAIQVLAQLYQQREQIKQSIYEITGISDIVRGATNAGETATAQQIKTQWGALRIQKMQRLIERQVRDVFVMMAHLISTKFSPETLSQMTGVEITEGVAALMQSPVDASYRVDVESDSTVRADLTHQKEEMANFLSGTANFFATVGPVVQTAPEAAEPFSEIYASAARMFKLGKQAEDALDRFVEMAKKKASSPQPDPQAKAMEAEAAMREQEFTLKREELGLKREEIATRSDIERQKLQQDGVRNFIDGAKMLSEQDFKERQFASNRELQMAEKRMVERNGGEEVLSADEVVIEAVEGLKENQAAIMEGLQQLAALIAAPKQVDLIRDENGRAKSAVQRPLLN